MVLLAGPSCAGPAPPASPSQPSSTESPSLLDALNRERRDADLEPLTRQAVLDRVAGERARRLSAAGRLDRPDLDAIMRRLSDSQYPVRSLEEASFVTSGAPVPADEVVATWRRHAADSFERFVSDDVTDLGVGQVTRGDRTVYTFLGALPERRFLARTVEALGPSDDLRRELLGRVNRARRDAGVAPLDSDPRLAEAAQSRADDMAVRGYYGHETPDGVGFDQVVERSEYGYFALAENIARGHASAAEVVQGWMDSPGHRANLLNPAFTEVGFGFAPGDPATGYTLLWVQILGRPAP